MKIFEEMFGVKQPILGMVHFPPPAWFSPL
jgi:hypothetical protein